MIRQLLCHSYFWPLAVAVALAADPNPLFAQDDPFGVGGATAKKEDAKDKKSVNLDALKAEGAGDGTERDPVVLGLRTSKPTKPEDLTQAVKLLLDVSRPDEANEYLEQLVDLKLEPVVLAGLRAKFGSPLFLRMVSDKTLEPLGKQFGQAVLDAARKAADDAVRINDLLGKLSNPSVEIRTLAANDLQTAGRAAIGPLVSLLADPSRAKAHPAARRLLVRLDQEAIEPLIGVLEAKDENVRAEAMYVLGQLEAARATPYLVRSSLITEPKDSQTVARAALLRIVGEAPSQHDAQQFLVRRIRGLLAGDLPIRLNHEDRAELWHWNSQRKTTEPHSYDAYEVSLVDAVRLARELSKLDPEPLEHRRLFLLTHLELAKSRAGFDQPLPRGDGTAHAMATQAGADALEDLLVYCLKLPRLVAAVAVTEVLGEIGTEELLLSHDGRARPLAAAATHADRRLRFAAMEAVLKIGPKQPFPGASYVADTLGYVTATVGTRRALVGHPRIDESQSLVGMLNELGYDAEAAQTGRGLFQRAVKQPDCEFLLLSDTIDHPAASEMLQMLRQDSHTATLAVGVIARPDFLKQAQRIVELDSYSEAFARPFDTAGMSFVVKRLAHRAARNLVGRDERVRQAAAALDWMARLIEAEPRYSFYELPRNQPAVETALQTPDLTAKAALVLGLFGSPRGQQSLLDVASQPSRPLADRQAAAAGFRTAVQRRGVRLTRDSLLLQYERFNQSETLDADTQQVLSNILDTIELKVQKSKPADAE